MKRTQQYNPVLWVFFVHKPSEKELQEQAYKMKNGVGYLYKDEYGDYIMRYNKKKSKGETFIKKVL